MNIKGNDIIVFAEINNKWSALALGLNCEIDVVAETISVSNPASGMWPKKKKKRMSWTGSSSNLVSDQIQTVDIKNMLLSKLPVHILIGSVDIHKEAANHEDFIPDGRFWFEGDALVTRATVTASKGSIATISMEFEGSGEPGWHDYSDVMLTGEELLHDNTENEYNVY